MIAAGRHPGHYFLGARTESLEFVRTGTVCEENVSAENNTATGRAGSVSEYASRRVMVCGGKDNDGKVRSDCLAYNPKSNEWTEHSTMSSAREEAASVVVRGSGDMIVFGGLVDGQVASNSERLASGSIEEGTWQSGPELPEARARFCAVSTDNGKVAIVGGETNEAKATTGTT